MTQWGFVGLKLSCPNLASLEPAGDAVEVEGMVAPVFCYLSCCKTSNVFSSGELILNNWAIEVTTSAGSKLTFPKPQCTPRWWRRPGWLGTRCTGPWCGSWLVRLSPFILILIAVATLVLNSEHKLSKNIWQMGKKGNLNANNSF